MENTNPPVASPSSPRSGWHAPAWFGASALFNMVAAVSAFNHDGRAGLRWGAVALVAALVGVCLRHREKPLLAQAADGASLVARLSPAVISLAGMSILLGVFSGVAAWTTRHWRGFDLWGTDNLYLRDDDVVHMALALSLAFLGLALWQAAAKPHARPRTGWRVGVTVLMVLLLGPEFAAEENGRDEYHALYVKRALADVWREPVSASVLLRWQTGSDLGDEPRLCVVLERRARFLLAWQTPFGDAPRESVCGARADAVLAGGLAVEAALLGGELDRYFAQVRADPLLRAKPVAVDIARLPPALGTALEALLTEATRRDFTPFDVALAARRKDDAVALMPEADTLQPHQRQGAFDLGMGASIGVADTPQAGQDPDEARQRRLQALLLAGQMGADEWTMRMMIASTLLGSHGRQESAGLGPFGPVDYVMANRRCDAGYANYLHKRGVLPAAAHALHLTSLIGRAQYPGISPEFSRSFPSADESLGLPDAAQLERCVELARFYARHIPSQAWAGAPGTPIDESPLGHLYLDAAAAAGQWYFRDAETWRKTHGLPPRVDDTRVVGAPEIAVEAAHALIAAQPVSFEQYCMWSNTWYTWMLQTKKQRPGLTKAMQELAASWRDVRPVPRAPQAQCRLVGLPWRTNEYDDTQQGLALLNADLRRLGIPCQWEGRPQTSLSCRMPVMR